MKPALLLGKEIRFLRTLGRESLQSFGNNFDIAASTVKNWEDTGNINSMIDFVIRNTVATKLQLLHNLSSNFLFHRSLLQLAKSRPSLEEYKIPYLSGDSSFLNDSN